MIFCYIELLLPRQSESDRSSFLLDQPFRVFSKKKLRNFQKKWSWNTIAVAPNQSNISGRMPMMEFVLYSLTLKISSASSVFNDFTWPLLLYKQSSIAWSWRLEKKKIMALLIQFHYKREVYYERTVQVECPVISLL